jgi:hypothetical protein
MFCSSKCCNSLTHRLECGKEIERNFKNLLLARMLHQSVEVAGSIGELQELMKQEKGGTIMEYDFSDSQGSVSNKNKVLATTSLAERTALDVTTSSKIDNILKNLDPKTSKECDFLRDFLLRCQKNMTVNFFHFFWSPADQPVGQGFALCLFAAYFAHSCDPNVQKIDVDNKFVFVVRKPVKAGHKLFINYDRFSFLTHTLQERRDYFNKFYEFKCNCNACESDYEMLSLLPKFDAKFEIKSEPETVEETMELWKKNCDYIKANIERYPSFEICFLMEQNYRLLHLIGNKLLK